MGAGLRRPLDPTEVAGPINQTARFAPRSKTSFIGGALKIDVELFLPLPACQGPSGIGSGRGPAFEATAKWADSVNTGADERDHLALDPGEELSHWFLIDIAVARELGRSLIGPPPAQVFSPIPKLWRLEAIGESLAWHQQHEPASANTMLNACRGWRYAATGESGSKRAGATWVSQEIDCLDVVVQAKLRQQDGLRFSAPDVATINERATEAVRAAIRQEELRGST